MSLPLTEKYRPRTLEDIRGNSAAIECLRSLSVETMPNLLLFGPPGTGKTTAIRALLRNHPPRDVLKLNASDERGIDTVRRLIKDFVNTKSASRRVVVLDEADSMSRDAQNALRRMIEDFPNSRFCLMCNFHRKLIEPIASRFTRIRFAPVATAARVIEVSRAESIECDLNGAEALEKYSDGDMRKVLNDLQGVAASYGVVNQKNVLEFFGLFSEDEFDGIYSDLCSRSVSFCDMVKAIKGKDIDCFWLIGGLVPRMLSRVENEERLARCVLLAEIEHRLARGCSEDVQLRAIVAAFFCDRFE